MSIVLWGDLDSSTNNLELIYHSVGVYLVVIVI